MHQVDGVWRCAGCGGQAFADRQMLQRHCKSAMHGMQWDIRKCPVCPKEYCRLPVGNLTRHIEQKHKGAGEGGEELL